MPAATGKLFQVTGGVTVKKLPAASVKGQKSLFNLGSAKSPSSLMPAAELLSYAAAFSCHVLAELRFPLHDTVTFQLSHYLVPTKLAETNSLAVVVLNRF